MHVHLGQNISDPQTPLVTCVCVCVYVYIYISYIGILDVDYDKGIPADLICNCWVQFLKCMGPRSSAAVFWIV